MQLVVRKRFIAGARCPQCHVEDKIYTLETEDGKSQHCAKCQYTETLSDSIENMAPEDQIDSVESAATWQVLKFPD